MISDLLKFTSLFKKAEKLYREEEEKITEYYKKSDKDAQYYLTMINKGTLSDKVNSLSELVAKNPTRSLSHLGVLLKEAKKKNRKQAEVAVVALRDLFTSDHLLQDDAKLTAF